VGDNHIGHLPGRAVRVERAVVLAAAHPGRSHDVQRGDAAAARLVTGSRAGRGELLVRTLFAWTITRAGLVAGVDLLRPGRLQQARRAQDAGVQVVAVAVGEGVFDDRVAVLAHLHPAAVAVAGDDADGGGARQIQHGVAVRRTAAPVHEADQHAGMHRAGLVDDAVAVAVEIGVLARDAGLQAALPRTQFLVEDAEDRRGRVQAQVSTDVLVAQAGAAQQRGGLHRAGRHHDGLGAHVQPRALLGAGNHALGPARLDLDVAHVRA